MFLGFWILDLVSFVSYTGSWVLDLLLLGLRFWVLLLASVGLRFVRGYLGAVGGAILLVSASWVLDLGRWILGLGS